MSDARDKPAPTPPAPRISTQPGRVITARRAVPLPKQKKPLREQLTTLLGGATLNVASIAKEQWQSLREADRYFKLRLAIVGSWVLITSLTLVLVCPSSQLEAKNNLGARLVVAGEALEPIYMLVNDSEELWKSVTVIVNGRYRLFAPQIEPHGTFALTPKQLVGAGNSPAPNNLRVIDIEVRTNNGKAELMRNGKPF